MIRIKQKTANVWEHTNGNIVNIAIITNVVHLLKTSNGCVLEWIAVGYCGALNIECVGDSLRRF